jgi:hypothetical protein
LHTEQVYFQDDWAGLKSLEIKNLKSLSDPFSEVELVEEEDKEGEESLHVESQPSPMAEAT